MAVKSAGVTATGTVVATQSLRVLGVHWVGAAAAGTIVLKDGGAAGTTRMTVNTPASAASAGFIPVAGGGMKFNVDVHATLTNAGAVMIVYEDA